jgi:hypothetical protein
MKYGNWTHVADSEPSRGRKRARWQCGCGVERVLFVSDVVQGRSRSCGCRSNAWRRMNAAQVAEREARRKAGR